MGGGVNGFPVGFNPPSDPTRLAEYWNDFMKPTDYSTNDWTVTTTEVGTGSATEAINNTVNGELLLTNAAGDNDLDSLQLQKETFKFVSGRAMYFKTRLKVSDATQSDWLVGLVITDTSPLTNTDGVYFKKDDGDTNIDFVVNKNSTASTSTAVATNADDTYVELAFHYDGTNGIDIYVNDVSVGGLPTTNMPDDEDLTVTLHIQNGEAVAKTMTIDYIYCAMERI